MAADCLMEPPPEGETSGDMTVSGRLKAPPSFPFFLQFCLDDTEVVLAGATWLGSDVKPGFGSGGRRLLNS